MHHLGAEETAAHLAKGPDARAFAQGRLLAGVEAEKAQRDLARAVPGPHDHLPARPELQLVAVHDHLDLHRLAAKGTLDRRDARFVLVAQRQMHQQIGLAMEADLGELLEQGLGSANRGIAPA
jgi:hypothetical protein